MADPIYLDYNATTPVAPEVIAAMIPALHEAWGNPSSDHAYGRRARRAIDRARAQVAGLLGCEPDEVVFTSGGTESNNAAIIGVAEARADRGRHLVTSAIEHEAVDEPLRYLERRDWAVTRVGPRADGRCDAADFEAVFRDDTTLVSVMHAHNETGVVQPIRAIADAARRRGITVHSDAAQSIGKLPVGVDDLGVDLLTVAGHKLYAPKGVGALYVRRGTLLSGFMHGAAHESGRRAGTESTPQIVGLGAACALAADELERRVQNMLKMRDRLEARLRESFPGLTVHGEPCERLPNTLFVALPGVDAGGLLSRLDGVAAAAGSACHAGETEPARVLRAMGVADEVARGTLRLTVGRTTTTDEIDLAASRIVEAAS